MGFKEYFAKKKVEMKQAKYAREDIRKRATAAALRAERTETIKVAEQRARERARRPSGFAGFTQGLGTLAKGINKLPISQASRKVTKNSAPSMPNFNFLGSANSKKKGSSILDFKF